MRAVEPARPSQEQDVIRLDRPAAGQAATSASGQEIRRQLAVAFDSAPVGMAVTTTGGTFVQVNAALAALLARPATQLVGARLEDLAIPSEVAGIAAGRQEMLASGVPRHVSDTWLRHAEGRAVPVTVTCALVPGSDSGQPPYLIVHVQDSTARQATEAELTHRTLHDPLTGLPNRVLLLDRLARALTRLQRASSTVALLFADLNGFKAVNDKYGHPAGDQVLVVVARRLLSVQRPGDTACRYGGDEFLVLCEDSGHAEAHSVVTRIHAALASPIRVTTTEPGRLGEQVTVNVTLTASIGLAATSDPTTSAAQLLHAADAQMYRAKHHSPDFHG